MIPLGAIKKDTNEYIYPKIANKNDKFECPECHKDLILRQGKIRIHHFAHCKTDNPCNYYTNPSESQIHKNAKMLMKMLLDKNIPIVIKRICRCCKKEEEYEIPERDNNSNIEIEYRFEFNGIKIADVAFVENNEIISIFEIYNTHKTDKEARPEPWFEINAFSLINTVNYYETDILKIYCIRNELCDTCVEKNNCKGFGECLLKTNFENKYAKNKDFQCFYNCKPKKCPINYCNAIAPEWYFDCHSGMCQSCAMGIEPLRIIMLDVPYSRKNEVKNLGAKFNSLYKKWCIRSNHFNKNIILSKFKEWKSPY